MPYIGRARPSATTASGGAPSGSNTTSGKAFRGQVRRKAPLSTSSSRGVRSPPSVTLAHVAWMDIALEMEILVQKWDSTLKSGFSLPNRGLHSQIGVSSSKSDLSLPKQTVHLQTRRLTSTAYVILPKHTV
eukprot:7161353-Heterocapsa_arctica.AAC.1